MQSFSFEFTPTSWEDFLYFFFSRIYCCHENVCKVAALNSPLLAGKIFDNFFLKNLLLPLKYMQSFSFEFTPTMGEDFDIYFFSRIYCCHDNVCKVTALNSPLLAGKIFDIYIFFFKNLLLP